MSDHRPVVVDASVALALILQEPMASEARRQIAHHRRLGAALIVPSVFWLEIVNALARGHRYRAADVLEAIYELDQLGLETRELGRAEVLLVIDASERHGLTAYDGAYLALAESTGAALLTGDRRLAAAAGPGGIFLGSDSGRIAESSGTYGSRTWAAWPGAAAYLRELRARSQRRDPARPQPL